MASTTHPTTALLPSLPPELRNEIYAYLSLPSPTPLNTHLPLQLKTFTCKHTTITLTPTHHGSPTLLSLPPSTFPEALEYTSWLLTNGLTLHISIHFHGRVNTFVQDHWNKKTSTHLRKLLKSFPWLSKVARYDIHVLWESADGALESKRGKRVAGLIPLDMANCLTQIMDEGVKRKKGDVKVVLHLEHRFAVGSALSSSSSSTRTTRFGLNRFLLGDQRQFSGFKRLVREVRKAPCVGHAPQPLPLPLHPAFLAVPSRVLEDRTLIEVEDGVVRWSEWTRGPLVMTTTTLETAEGRSSSVLRQGQEEQAEFPICHLMADCMEM